MDKLRTIFEAGRLRRWHTNAHLSHTNDTLDGHSARVARIILALHPDPSFDLIRMALIHDDGESFVGDMPAPIKPKLHPQFERMETDAREDIWGPDPLLDRDEQAWLKLADKLDAYQWARHHAPHLIERGEWAAARDALLIMANDLGCRDAVWEVVG